jgi:hypothetical protein
LIGPISTVTLATPEAHFKSLGVEAVTWVVAVLNFAVIGTMAAATVHGAWA